MMWWEYCNGQVDTGPPSYGTKHRVTDSEQYVFSIISVSSLLSRCSDTSQLEHH